jgi:hypothetical protein
MRPLLAFLFMVFTIAPAQAVNFFHELENQMDELQAINAPTALDANASAVCRQRYQRLFADGVLDVVVGFGYTDSSTDIVYDWYMVNGFRIALTGPCRQGLNACEFKQLKNSPDVYVRSITGPDGKERKVRLTLLRPSLSGSQAQNIGALKAQQQAHCQQTETRFYQEISNGAEVVYYSGHSRNGGAPDFCPPRTLSNGHVDYDSYERNPVGRNKLIDSLKANAAKTQIIAMHSCDSTRHYRWRMLNANPRLAIFSTPRLVKMAPDFQNQYGGLDALLSLRCERGLKASMAREFPMDVHGRF